MVLSVCIEGSVQIEIKLGMCCSRNLIAVDILHYQSLLYKV